MSSAAYGRSDEDSTLHFGTPERTVLFFSGTYYGEWMDYAPQAPHDLCGSIVVNLTQWDAALIVTARHPTALPRVVVFRDDALPREQSLHLARVMHSADVAWLVNRSSMMAQRPALMQLLQRHLPEQTYNR